MVGVPDQYGKVAPMSLSTWFSRSVRDPVSGFSHLAGAFLGVGGLVFLLLRTTASGEAHKVWAAAIFGSSIILLYLSSATYHLLRVSEKTSLVLRRIDHALIFTLIAGSYTPFCLVTLRNNGGTELLAIVWGIALAGLALSIFWIHAPRWLSTALYLFMGWFLTFYFRPIIAGLTTEALTWLVAGGLFYSFGAIIYAVKRPDPFPPHFGFHEIWHLMVLAGTTCHFVSITYVLS